MRRAGSMFKTSYVPAASLGANVYSSMSRAAQCRAAFVPMATRLAEGTSSLDPEGRPLRRYLSRGTRLPLASDTRPSADGNALALRVARSSRGCGQMAVQRSPLRHSAVLRSCCEAQPVRAPRDGRGRPALTRCGLASAMPRRGTDALEASLGSSPASAKFCCKNLSQRKLTSAEADPATKAGMAWL